MASSSSLIVSIHSNLLSSFFPFLLSFRMLFAKPRVSTVVFQPLAHLFDAHVEYISHSSASLRLSLIGPLFSLTCSCNRQSMFMLYSKDLR